VKGGLEGAVDGAVELATKRPADGLMEFVIERAVDGLVEGVYVGGGRERSTVLGG
jgi:hypothetical protein